ncbi:hypothetical protein XaC1_75 [Xanthomonas phage XaC1]|nr:hypothetical protein XaC1_75 [Xanthomonas phage XaC1]
MFVNEIRVLQKCIDILSAQRGGTFTKSGLKIEISMDSTTISSPNGFSFININTPAVTLLLIECSNNGGVFLKNEHNESDILCMDRVLNIYENDIPLQINLDDIKNCTPDEKFNLSVMYSERTLKYVDILLGLDVSAFNEFFLNIEWFESYYNDIELIVDGIDIEEIWGDK